MKISVFYDHVINAAKQNNTDVESMLRSIKALGIDFVEMDAEMLAGDFDNITGWLRNAKIGISCIYRTFDYTHKKEMRRSLNLIRLAVKSGSKGILIIPGFTDGITDKEAYNKSIPQVAWISKKAVKKGLLPLMEDFDYHTSTCSDIKGLSTYLEAVPELSLAFDTGNFIYSGEDDMDAFNKLNKRIRHVHLKDRSYTDTGSDHIDTVAGKTIYTCPVGLGDMPIKEILHRLKDMDYDGIFAIEHFGACDHYEYMKKSVQYIKGIWND